MSFGEHPAADVRLRALALLETCSTVDADICGQATTFKVGAPGRHWVQNSLAALAAVQAVGGDLGRAVLALANLDPGPGRGRRLSVDTPDGAFDVIDDSYNANPVSMKAALAVLGASHPPGRGRRIAVLGDMRELGTASQSLHAALAAAVDSAGVDLVFTVGHQARALHAALPPARRGGHADAPFEAAAQAIQAVRPGDTVLVKGSNATGLGAVVEALAALTQRRGAA